MPPSVIFVVVALVFMYIGRRVGWALSKNILYIAGSGAVIVALCLVWGVAVAYCVHALIAWLHPHIVVKVIFGYMLGAYVAIPNYGLVAESTIPEHAMPRHNLISMLPLWTYIALCIVFAWLL